MARCVWLIAVAIGTVGCGSSNRQTPSPEDTPASVEPQAREVTAVADTTAETQRQQAAPPTPVDLLRAVRTEIAASSAYRDRGTLVGLMADGDLETAWNSQSGDLVGAWVDVRVPNGASVSSIEMTVGFTRVGDSDLFTGNHRIRRVRVLRDGQEVLTQELDVDSRELQSLPVRGPGGVYRIEVVEVLPGTRSNWREVCISELRVLGRAPVVQDGRRFPRFAVGALPPARPAEAPPIDRPALARTLARHLPTFAASWARFETEVLQDAHASGDPGVMPDIASEYERDRRRLLSQLLAWTDPVAEIEADGLRLAAARRGAWGEEAWSRGSPDFDAVADALDALAAASQDDAGRCAAALAHAEVRLHRVAFWIAKVEEWNEMTAMEASLAEETEGQWNGPDPATLPDYVELAGNLDLLRRDLARQPARTARSFLAIPPPDERRVTEDWSALRADLEAAVARCGWRAP